MAKRKPFPSFAIRSRKSHKKSQTGNAAPISRSLKVQTHRRSSECNSQNRKRVTQLRSLAVAKCKPTVAAHNINRKKPNALRSSDLSQSQSANPLSQIAISPLGNCARQEESEEARGQKILVSSCELISSRMAASPSVDRSGQPAYETRIPIADSKSDTIGEMVDSLTKKLEFKRHMITTECCIYRVPKRLRGVNEDVFTPQVVSIGPFHHCKSDSYKAIENHKFCYLKSLLNRSNSNTLLEEFLKSLQQTETQARACYAEHINLPTHEFLEIMLLDGCFIIELFLRNLNENEDFDPLLNSIQAQSTLWDDLLLLENQMPFFILNNLFDLFKTHASNCSNITLIQLALLYFYDIKPEHAPRDSPQVLHLLDLALQKYTPSKKVDSRKSNVNDSNDIVPIPKATSLREAGVTFKPVKRHLLDINFEKGVLEIPVIEVEDTTELLFRNMMVFEQCHGHSTHVADYTILMDHLIDTGEDVKLLREVGIITSWLGDDVEVSDMFNKLGKNISTTDRFHYCDLYERLNDHYKATWPKLMAKLKQDYFQSPWSIIAFAAAGIGLICTVAQTFLTLK